MDRGKHEAVAWAHPEKSWKRADCVPRLLVPADLNTVKEPLLVMQGQSLEHSASSYEFSSNRSPAKKEREN